MPIVLRHQAAGIAPDQENPRTKYGMAMVLQQQRSDQEMRQRAQDAQYDMQRMGAMGAMREMREPSIGEDDAMLEQEIRSGLYDPDTVRALRQDQRAMRQIMRDTNIDGTQRAQALGNLQSRMRMSRSTGKVQPMMQQMGPAALQTKPPMTEADYFSDEKNYANAYAAAQARLEAAGPDTPATPENIQAQMHNDYLARQKFLEGLRQPQPQGQPAAQPPNAPAAAPATNPQASYTGGQSTFGASPVMAQGGMGAPVGQGAYQPTGSYTSPEVFGAANVLANTAQPSQQQPTQYPMQAVSEMQVQGQPAATQRAGVRTWTSNDGKFTTQGEFQGFAPNLSPDGSQIALIKKSDNGKVVSVPLDRLSREDSMLLMTGGNPDTQYALQNPRMSEGLAYMDPNNPVRREMSAADQSIVNPQKETLGSQYKGRYGLGGADFGINPATGNHVTASVRPGGTMLEYDEPVGPPGTAMGGRKGSVTIMGGRKKPAPAAQQQGVVGVDVSPGGKDVKAGLSTDAPIRISRDDPRVKQAEAIAVNPNASEDEQNRAADILKNAGYKEQDVARLAASSSATQSGKKKLRDPFWGPVGEFLADPLGEYNPLVGSKQNANVPASRSVSAPSRGQMLNASPSLLGQLEQAEPASASSVVPSPAGSVTQDQGELRTWTSVDGRTFEGSIVEGSLDPTAKTISVKRKDGQVFSNVPIDRFGEEDRAYIDALYKVGNATNWTEKPDSRMGKGQAYQYDKPAGNQEKKTTPKSKYIGETPKEVYQRPPSSSRSTAKRTG